jgi:hypothetical protein
METALPSCPTLTRADEFEVIMNLECALEVFNRAERDRALTTLELYVRSVISIQRREMIRHAEQ